MAYPSQYDNKLEVNTNNKNYKIRRHIFGWQPAMFLKPVMMEYKR